MLTHGAYFKADGQPRPEAEPFFEYRCGSDDPEPGPEFLARREAVAGKPGAFDDELILQSLVEGWSIEETQIRGLEIAADLEAQKRNRLARNRAVHH